MLVECVFFHLPLTKIISARDPLYQICVVKLFLKLFNILHLSPFLTVNSKSTSSQCIVVRYELLEWLIHLVAFPTRSGNTLLCSEM